MEFWSKFFDSIAFFQKAIFIFGQNLFHDSQLYQQMAFPEKRMTISDITEERPEFIEGRPAVILPLLGLSSFDALLVVHPWGEHKLSPERTPGVYKRLNE